MLKLSKKVEYSLLAASYMTSKNEDELVSAKQMAKDLNISFEFLSKCLQLLMKKGIIQSQQGIKGGYQLTNEPTNISLWDIITAVDEKVGIVECTHHSDSRKKCDLEESCDLRDPMIIIQRKINNIFKSTTLSDITPDNIIEKNLVSENFIAIKTA